MLSMTGSPLETDEDGASDHHRAGFRVSDRLSTHELNRLFVSTLYPLLIAPRLNILNHTQLSMLSMEASKSRIAFVLPEIDFPARLWESTGGWMLLGGLQRRMNLQPCNFRRLQQQLSNVALTSESATNTRMSCKISGYSPAWSSKST